jgi:hypothetical protein
MMAVADDSSKQTRNWALEALVRSTPEAIATPILGDIAADANVDENVRELSALLLHRLRQQARPKVKAVRILALIFLLFQIALFSSTILWFNQLLPPALRFIYGARLDPAYNAPDLALQLQASIVVVLYLSVGFYAVAILALARTYLLPSEDRIASFKLLLLLAVLYPILVPAISFLARTYSETLGWQFYGEGAAWLANPTVAFPFVSLTLTWLLLRIAHQIRQARTDKVSRGATSQFSKMALDSLIGGASIVLSILLVAGQAEAG